MADVSYFGTMMVHKGLADGMVSRRPHHHHPAGLRVHPHQARHLDRVQRVPDAAGRPGAGLRRLRGGAQPQRRAAGRHRRRLGGHGGPVRHRAPGGPAVLLDRGVGRGQRRREGPPGDGDRQRAPARPPDRGADPVRRGHRPRGRPLQAARQPGRRPGHGVRVPRPEHRQQHLQGGAALGQRRRRRPVLQGLRKPVNDLSRGALVADIVNTVAITAIQAQGAASMPRVLVVNTGSSSIKYQLFEMGPSEAGRWPPGTARVLASERIGEPGPS